MSKPQKLPSGAWRIRYINADGERVSKTFETFDLARSELRRLEVEADEQRARRERLGTGALTVGEAGERYLANYPRMPDDTDRRYLARKGAHERHFETHIKPHIADVKLCDLSPPVLRRWLEALATTKTSRRGEKNEDGRTLSSSTIRNVTTTLRQIAKAHDVPLVVMLPERVRQKRRRTKPRALQSIADVRALVAACSKEPWFQVAVAVACYCGARLGEVASLRWRHIGEQTVTIAMSWEGPLKARYEDDEEAARTVPLDPELAAILAAWRTVTRGGPDDRVVLVNGERPLREGYDDMAAKTRSACKRAGLTPLTFHSLRASFATIVAGAGLPVSWLQALLGHADARTTAIYMRPDSERAALDPRARLSMSPRVEQDAELN